MTEITNETGRVFNFLDSLAETDLCYSYESAGNIIELIYNGESMLKCRDWTLIEGFINGWIAWQHRRSIDRKPQAQTGPSLM